MLGLKKDFVYVMLTEIFLLIFFFNLTICLAYKHLVQQSYIILLVSGNCKNLLFLFMPSIELLMKQEIFCAVFLFSTFSINSLHLSLSDQFKNKMAFPESSYKIINFVCAVLSD